MCNPTIRRIFELKEERNAVMLVHNYQRPEIQDIADFVGDSLGLSRQAAETDADVIVFCGVHFMAETAKILSPEKTVLLPESDAGCPMADMITAEQLKEARAEHPNAAVVCYVNSSAAVKAESDVCCTSSNAVQVIEAVESDEVLFVPDQNLGRYTASRTDKTVHLWPGYCRTHLRILAEDVRRLKEEHPDAVFMAHPECTPDVLELADEIASTSGMIEFARESDAAKIIVGTETGIIHRLKKDSPEKEFLFTSRSVICPNMKMTTLDKVLDSLEELHGEITVPEEIRIRALRAVERMVEIG